MTERQAVEMLEHHMKETQRFPTLPARIQLSLEAANQQHARLEDMPSAASGTRTDFLAQGAHLDEQAEHVQGADIAAYELLNVVAHTYRDTFSARGIQPRNDRQRRQLRRRPARPTDATEPAGPRAPLEQGVAVNTSASPTLSLDEADEDDTSWMVPDQSSVTPQPTI